MLIYLNPLILSIDFEDPVIPYAKEILVAGIRRTVPVALSLFNSYLVLNDYYHNSQTDSIPKIIGNTFSVVVTIIGYTIVVCSLFDTISRKLDERIGG